ncbi:MAG: tripartite tricarboxylate transporter TctB family protein [Proteobacteria bacterium]|nr:tripartite tricarboxylate transporter TctB family protein [Pseudomonadota bacterium]MBU1740077.1 tripartite tricarboxylate transporter TctB family protein [Pseudomonadota bacterium]
MALGLAVSVHSCRLGLGQLSRPDAGTLPFGLGIILAVCAAALFIRSGKTLLRRPRVGTASVWAEVNFTKVTIIPVGLLLYIFLLEPLGFLACAFVVQLLLFKVAGGQKWLISVLQTVVTLVFVYVVFFLCLGVYVRLLPTWVY